MNNNKRKAGNIFFKKFQHSKYIQTENQQKASKRARYNKQKKIDEEGRHFLDDENSVIVIHDFFDDAELVEYEENLYSLERVQGYSCFSFKTPRKEVCFTLDGKPFVYSQRQKYTTKYPDFVLAIVDKILAEVSKNVPNNIFANLSTGISIEYSEEHDRGGSIGRHKDNEYKDDPLLKKDGKVWGLIIVISIGQERWFRVRDDSTREFTNVKLRNNSLIAMHGKTFQEKYTHQIDKLRKNDKVGKRYSLNIRFTQ